MSTIKKKIAVLALLLGTLCANAQTDITSTYLTNPSFEDDDTSTMAVDATRGAYTATALKGWSLTGGYGVSDIMTADATATDNNFGRPGTPSDGKQMYYIRHSWQTATANLTQSVKLPKGKYRLSVDSKCVSGSSHTVKVVAQKEGTNLPWSTSMPTAWNTTNVDFELTAEATVSMGLTINFGSGSGGSILIDNFRLYDMSSYVEPEPPTEESVPSPTEGVIDNTFVSEKAMKADLLQMLANFSEYMVNDFFDCQYPNSVSEQCGYFNGESSGANNEAGVRTNADLSMICAFLVKYGKPAGVKLPAKVTWERIEEIAMKSLVFAYSTHKANKLKITSNNAYWGSVSTSDAVWESSLWAMSVAYSAFFQWNKLSDTQKGYIYAMLKAECNYELNRSIPTGYSGDTKAEENGWEADVLAATLGLFPNDELAPKWFARLREFAVNSYSHHSDATNTAIIDPEYDNTTVADLYKGNNLYGDYTLQNHNLFHTSYQNVVMQELGEAALALKMFQLGTTGTEKWKTNALMHNNQEVMDSVMNWLALADGELAMPNGNDWSLFLYDQITSYTTQACFQRDANALTLENLAYKQIKARQTTTKDGSWLLRPDVSARRMGVEAHRVMMTYLMHDILSTDDLKPTDWEDFRNAHSEAKILPYQNVVRAYTKDRFTTFSWSTGLKSYTGYFAQDNANNNKIVVPYRANNTGNITGWYEVSGKGTNASPVVSGIYQLDGNAYVMNGEMNTNDNTLNNRFAIYSTPGNALIYLDCVNANTDATISAEKGGLLAISTDELTKLYRTLYYDKGDKTVHAQTDGSSMVTFNSEWINIDNQIGIASTGNGKKMAFGDRGANNSIYTSKLYPAFANDARKVKGGATVDARNLVYYSNVSAEQTRMLQAEMQKPAVPEGWNAVMAADPDGTIYLLASNFRGKENTATIADVACKLGAPVFATETAISKDGKASTTVKAMQNHSAVSTVKMFVKNLTGTAIQVEGDKEAAYLTATKDSKAEVTVISEGKALTETISISKGKTAKVYAEAGSIKYDIVETHTISRTETDYTPSIVNPNFDEGTMGWTGAPTVNHSAAEKFNTSFDVNQTISGLPAGVYRLSCQGFYRKGSYDNAANLHSQDKENISTVLYAESDVETESTPMLSIFSEAGKVGNVGVKQNKYGYIPNSMEQAAFYFKAGLYDNHIDVRVGNGGTLKIGIKNTSSVSNDWTIFDKFELMRYPDGDYSMDGANINFNSQNIL